MHDEDSDESRDADGYDYIAAIDVVAGFAAHDRSIEEAGHCLLLIWWV
jgi:hypothetical protein